MAPEFLPNQGGKVIMSTANNEFADLFESLWEDEDILFEAKTQDVAIELAAAVERAGLSRAALAKQLNWKPSRVTKVLTGTSNLTLKTIFQVCRAIGLEFDVVLRKAHERAEIVDSDKHQTIYQEAINNLYKSRQLLQAATALHRKVSQSALATRNYTREEARIKLVA
jgi:plasmid maintenance system antidote protein VapI